MSKPKHPRALAETEAQAVLSNIRVSPRKLNLVAGMIRNLPAGQAVATLTFSKRRIAQQVQQDAAERDRQRREQPSARCRPAWSSRGPRSASRS